MDPLKSPVKPDGGTLNSTANKQSDKKISKKDKKFGYKNFKKWLTHAFNSYDSDKSGCLDPDEMREFINELRKFLNQQPIEDKLFNQIIKILDDDGNGDIEIQEFLNSMSEVLPLISEQGDEMKVLLTKTFKDFDIDQDGILCFRECKLQFDLSCDKIGVERCENWEITFIISMFSENDSNAIIDQQLLSFKRIKNCRKTRKINLVVIFLETTYTKCGKVQMKAK